MAWTGDSSSCHRDRNGKSDNHLVCRRCHSSIFLHLFRCKCSYAEDNLRGPVAGSAGTYASGGCAIHAERACEDQCGESDRKACVCHNGDQQSVSERRSTYSRCELDCQDQERRRGDSEREQSEDLRDRRRKADCGENGRATINRCLREGMLTDAGLL